MHPNFVIIGPGFLGCESCDTKDELGHCGTSASFPKQEKLILKSMPNLEEYAKEVGIGEEQPSSYYLVFQSCKFSTVPS